MTPSSEDRLSSDPVQQIRASNDAWHRRDLDAALAIYADDIEWDTTEAFLDGRVYRGMPAFRAQAEEILERWGRDEHHLEIQQILQVEATSTVVVEYRMTGRSRSGVPIDAPWVHVFDFRGRRIRRARNFTSLDAAVKSLGAVRVSSLWNPSEE